MSKLATVDISAMEPDSLKGGDVYKWALEQSAHILARRFDKVDIVNVADEIESVGKSEFRSLTSNVEVVLVHMLKWDHQPQRQSRSWVDSIDEHRARIELDLSGSPSLRTRVNDALDHGYRLGRYVAARETRLSRKAFPETCPYDWNAVMTRPFVLEQANEPS